MTSRYAPFLPTLALVLVSAMPPAAQGAPANGGSFSGELDDNDSIVIDGSRRIGSPSGGPGNVPGGSNASPVSNPTGSVTIERYVYACPGNTYASSPATNTPCEESFQFCTIQDDRQFYRYTTTIPASTPAPPPGTAWTLNGVLCLPTGAADPAAPQAAPVPVVTLADFRSLPLPAAEPTVQPNGGEALIRARTNVYVDPASTGVETFDITLLGTPVTVRATPLSWTWDFGDGSPPLVTEDPGAPYPDLTTWHEYETPGDVAITLTTTYAGAYSVAGGAFLDIAGTAEVDSAPVDLQLLSTTNRLTG